jgi:hypothetical protein
MLAKKKIIWIGVCSIALFILVAVFIASCGKKSELVNSPKERHIGEDPLSQNEFLKQNVAFVDARIRSISETSYVREIVLINFSKENRMPSSLIFDETTFFDDGSYNDLEANDGVYTSAAEFGHSKTLPYNKRATVRSVMKKIIVDQEFLHEKEIDNIARVYSKPGSSYEKNSADDLSWFKIGVKCKIEFGTCGCRADRWGWCWCCCFTIYDCTGYAEFEWKIW